MSPPAGGILTDPGPLCPEQRTNLTCEVTADVVLLYYGLTFIVEIYPNRGINVPPGPIVVNAAGVEFSISIISAGIDPVSKSVISFVPTIIMNNTQLVCYGQASLEYGTVTLHVQNISMF